jgi:hypothetical protein
MPGIRGGFEELTQAKKNRVFICGIIQGSHKGLDVHGQDYRTRIRRIVEKHMPSAEVYCPVSLHPESPVYGDKKAFQVFEESVKAAGESDLLIAYLPEASMGSAIEMWEARRAGVKVISITPLRENWVVRYASDLMIDSIEDLARLFEDSAVEELLQK